jgi:exodeoxyribonuclease VII large subunit
MEPQGLGALQLAFDQLRKRLQDEGLFDVSRKRPLPALPRKIGIVTSLEGAAIRDIIKILRRRHANTHLVIRPARVQGEGAALEIARGVRAIGRVKGVDVVIVGRGGGSIEDLWAFNEEIVVRAVADCRIPLISAVGHETDVTLIDFVSDKRAPTPTAAAEIAVPVKSELIARVDNCARRALACWSRAQEHRRTELRAAARALPTADTLLAIPRQRLDACADRLPRALRANAQVHHTAFTRIAAQLSPQLLRARLVREDERVARLAGQAISCLRVTVERRRARFAAADGLLASGLRHNAEAQRTRIARARERIEALMQRAARALVGSIDRRVDRIERAGQLLGALSYHGVLARGFALVRGPESQPLRSAAAVASGMRLDIEFQDGHVGAVASTGATGQREPIAARQPRPRRRSAGGEGQGSLF